ncbi:hypothetical protein C8R45DRAFT_1099219 [Mycena sanguinolenta]|nr:hypothetical protein C8R45DRAFT_1099219 [Mycena sanguinolenta]
MRVALTIQQRSVRSGDSSSHHPAAAAFPLHLPRPRPYSCANDTPVAKSVAARRNIRHRSTRSSPSCFSTPARTPVLVPLPLLAIAGVVWDASCNLFTPVLLRSGLNLYTPHPHER